MRSALDASIRAQILNLLVSGRSVGIVTALTPYIGYAAAADVAKAALAGAGDVRTTVLKTGVLTEHVLDELLRPERLSGVADAITVG